MSRSDLPPKSDAADSTASELHALYREAAHAEPDAMLDRKILDAARAELRDAGAAKARRQPPWWQGWLPAASALALALVGVSLTWRVMDQQESDLRQEMKASEAVSERSVAAPASVAPVQGAADAPPRRDTAPAAEISRRAEPTALKDAPPRVPEPAVTSAPAAPAPMEPMVPMAPAVADEAMKKSGRSEKEDLRERRDASAAVGAAAGAASSSARQAGKFEAGRPGTASSSETAAEVFVRPSANSVASPAAKSVGGSLALPPPDAATPEVWLKQIRELRAAGRGAEAAQSLARFRARYPDYALPGDLLDLK